MTDSTANASTAADTVVGIGARLDPEVGGESVAPAQRLEEISRLPIASRATEFAAIHDSLQAALQDGDIAPSHG